MAGAALDTRGQKTVAPDASPGWTRVLMERAPRLLWDRQCGRQARQVFHNAMRLLGHGSEPTGARTRLTDGERRSGRLWVARWSEALRTGQRGRPKQPLRKGGNVRLKNPGAQRHQRGRKRPKDHAPEPEPPAPAQSLATTAMQAHPLEAFHTALRRRGAAYRRRTKTSATHQPRLQESVEVSWMGHHGVRVHLTTRQGPAVA